MSQITIAIPDDTNRQLSVAAQASGLTIEQFIHDLILEGIAQRQADEQDAQEALSVYHEVTNTNQVYSAEAVAEYMRAKLTDPNAAGPSAIKWQTESIPQEHCPILVDSLISWRDRTPRPAASTSNISIQE